MIGMAVDTISWQVDRVSTRLYPVASNQVPEIQLEVDYVAKPPHCNCYINSSIKQETPYMLRVNSFQIDLTTPFMVFSVTCVIVSLPYFEAYAWLY